MANLRVLTTLRNTQLNALRDAIDAGATGGTIKFYTGSQPATPETALSGQTLLGTCAFAKPSAPNAASAALTFNAIVEDSSADATGTATWARIADSNGNTVADVDVGVAGVTINLNTTSIVTGGPIRVSSGSISLGG